MSNDAKNVAQVEEKQKPKAVRRLGEEDLASKLDNIGRPVTYEKGSLQFVDDAAISADEDLALYEGKQIVRKRCEGDYEDGEEAPIFIVATSDLHQCFYAPGMRKTMRNKKAKERREVAKAKREADAAELAGHREAAAS